MTYGRARASWAATPKRKNKRTESELMRPAFEWLFAHGCYAWRNNTGAYKTESGRYVSYGLKGSADILGLTPAGRFLAVELKGERGKLSEDQLQFAERVRGKNGIYVAAWGIDDLERELKPLLGPP